MKKATRIMVKAVASAIIAIFLISSLLAFCGCSDALISNRRIWRDGNHTFNHAYVNIRGTWEDVRIKSWCDFPDGDEVQVWTEDGRCILSHYSNIVLVNDHPSH